MCRPQSDSPSGPSCTCPTGGVRYYFRSDTHAAGTDAAAGRNDMNSPAAIVSEPSSQEREYEYIDVNREIEG